MYVTVHRSADIAPNVIPTPWIGRILLVTCYRHVPDKDKLFIRFFRETGRHSNLFYWDISMTMVINKVVSAANIDCIQTPLEFNSSTKYAQTTYIKWFEPFLQRNTKIKPYLNVLNQIRKSSKSQHLLFIFDLPWKYSQGINIYIVNCSGHMMYTQNRPSSIIRHTFEIVLFKDLLI